MKFSTLSQLCTVLCIAAMGECSKDSTQGNVSIGAKILGSNVSGTEILGQKPKIAEVKETDIGVQEVDPKEDPFLADLIKNLKDLTKEVKEPMDKSSRSLGLPTYLSHGNVDNAKLYARYAGAAYCSDSTIESWTCSHCKTFKGGVKHIATFFDKKTESRGYLAINQSKKELILAFRGSSTAKNFLQDSKFFKDPFKIKNKTFKVHKGFKQCSDALIGKYLPHLRALLNKHPDFKLVITGHSLGGAIGLLSLLDIRSQLGLPDSRLKLYTFGEPRVGDEAFATYVNLQRFTSIRVVNGNDIVPHLPPQSANFYHHHHEVWVQSGKHTNCTTTSLEHSKCSLSKWYWPSVSDHLKVWDITLGGTC